ncbi:hypothetical protein NY40_0873 [Helicobacter pylori NY40]|uniref:Uncharacterized protein n=1 Tax=Helicobacter pylori NY40 TaxID=1426844 RepID=A0A060PQQ6_HELPX|nr:hypothetical protein NY40_0873 [Helicobacter pylori NY40]
MIGTKKWIPGCKGVGSYFPAVILMPISPELITSKGLAKKAITPKRTMTIKTDSFLELKELDGGMKRPPLLGVLDVGVSL